MPYHASNSVQPDLASEKYSGNLDHSGSHQGAVQCFASLHVGNDKIMVQFWTDGAPPTQELTEGEEEAK
jgi:hypothetical protein